MVGQYRHLRNDGFTFGPPIQNYVVFNVRMQNANGNHANICLQ